MLPQERLIGRVRDVCRRDARLDAALMYGSFAQRRADEHSDIEFWLFFNAQDLPDVDPYHWCQAIAPVNHLVLNEFGTHVAFFPGLIRGEFHFASADDIPAVGTWPARTAPANDMIVLDRNNRLRPVLEALPATLPAARTWEEVSDICGRFANWLVLAHHVACRDELFRAVDALGHAHRHLLWMARLVEGRTDHWLTPSRAAEAELAPTTTRSLVRATATADLRMVRAALHVSWACGRTYWTELATRHSRTVPHALFAELDSVLTAD